VVILAGTRLLAAGRSQFTHRLDEGTIGQFTRIPCLVRQSWGVVGPSGHLTPCRAA
jgi:hypothetical protein